MKKTLVMISAIILLAISSAHAQDYQTGKKQDKSSGMGMSSLSSCMEQIASDSTARLQMVSRIMNSMKGDSAGMKQVCLKMMGNPEMHQMMMKMMREHGMGEMKGMGGKMQDDVMDHDMMKGDTIMNNR